MSLFVSETKEEFLRIKLSWDIKFLIIALDNKLKCESYVSNAFLKVNIKVTFV